MCGEAEHSISIDFIAQHFREEAAARMREAEARFEQLCKEGKVFTLARVVLTLRSRSAFPISWSSDGIV